MRLPWNFIVFLSFAHIVFAEITKTAETETEDAYRGSFGDKTVAKTPTNQAKRDISLSYTATDIDSKEGARFKTITVIKNLNKDGTSEMLTVNPELHKNENWADAFRDNFDSYGSIPDVPDIDDLFEFMNKKKPKAKPKADRHDNKFNKIPSSSSSSSSLPSPSPSPSPSQSPSISSTSASRMMSMTSRKPYKGRKDDVEKPVIEPETFGMDSVPTIMKATAATPSLSTITTTISTTATTNKSRIDSKPNVERSSPTVEKIKGDAELIPFAGNSGHKRSQNTKNGNDNQASGTRSQSLSLGKEKIREQLVNVNYSTPHHTVHQYFENYVQENTQGYDYPRPCQNVAGNSVTVTTPSGRTYDIPRTNSAAGVNNGALNPYIAPGVIKKPQPSTLYQTPTQQTIPQPLPPIQINPVLNVPSYNQQPPTYSVNSIVSPLQPTQNFVGPPRVPVLQNRPQSNLGAAFSTSQRPYVAPNIRTGLGYSRGPPPTPIYNVASGTPNYRTNFFTLNKLNIGRSRGLKY